jgi:hypothetical protein
VDTPAGTPVAEVDTPADILVAEADTLADIDFSLAKISKAL